MPAAPAQVQDRPAKPDYQNPALPTARRVDDLLSRMTLEEKVAQMLCIWNAKRQITDAKGPFELGTEELSYHGPDVKRVVEPGRFRVMVGGNSEKVRSVGLEVPGQ